MLNSSAIAAALNESRASRKGNGLFGMRVAAAKKANAPAGVGSAVEAVLTGKEARAKKRADEEAQRVAKVEAAEAARQETLKEAYATNNTDYKRAKRRDRAELVAPEIGSDVYTRNYLDAAGNPEVEYKGPQFGDFGGSGKALVDEEEEEVLKVDVLPPTDKKPSGKREAKWGEFGMSPTKKQNAKINKKNAGLQGGKTKSSSGLFGMRGWGK